jgi:hypothetical protein
MLEIHIAVSIVVFATIALLAIVAMRNTKEKGITPLAGLAFAFVLAGIVFGDDRFIGYGLLEVGVVLAVVDKIKKSRASSHPGNVPMTSA